MLYSNRQWSREQLLAFSLLRSPTLFLCPRCGIFACAHLDELRRHRAAEASSISSGG